MIVGAKKINNMYYVATRPRCPYQLGVYSPHFLRPRHGTFCTI
jgi:hypothetical protein